MFIMLSQNKNMTLIMITFPNLSKITFAKLSNFRISNRKTTNLKTFTSEFFLSNIKHYFNIFLLEAYHQVVFKDNACFFSCQNNNPRIVKFIVSFHRIRMSSFQGDWEMGQFFFSRCWNLNYYHIFNKYLVQLFLQE